MYSALKSKGTYFSVKVFHSGQKNTRLKKIQPIYSYLGTKIGFYNETCSSKIVVDPKSGSSKNKC